MPKNKFYILSTRPVGKAMILEATANNIIIDEISFISTEEIIYISLAKKIRELSHQNITAVFTSVNAVNAVGKLISWKTNWKIYCIGNTTKKIAIKIFGQENISATAYNANQLAEKIINDSPRKNIIFFCGDQRRNELPEKMKENGVDIKEMVVYKTIETPHVITKKYGGILFFSPSAVKSYFSVNDVTDSTKLFAIGNTTANEIKNFTKVPVIISEIPGKENLIKLAIENFSKIKTF